MAGHPLKKIQCESIARTSGKQCRAKGYLMKSRAIIVVASMVELQREQQH